MNKWVLFVNKKQYDFNNIDFILTFTLKNKVRQLFVNAVEILSAFDFLRCLRILHETTAPHKSECSL